MSTSKMVAVWFAWVACLTGCFFGIISLSGCDDSATLHDSGRPYRVEMIDHGQVVHEWRTRMTDSQLGTFANAAHGHAFTDLATGKRVVITGRVQLVAVEIGD